MPADYKPRDDLKQKKSLPGYIWLLSGLTIGLFIALIIYISKQPASPVDFGAAVEHELQTLNQKNKPAESTVAKQSTQQGTKSMPSETMPSEAKYNFYTILQGMKVLIPESETRPPVGRNGSDLTPANTRYLLQAGSFQNREDAEKLKARLAFLGVEADIQEVQVNRQTWHRVRTGPFKDKAQLYRNLKILQRNNINAISLEVK